MQGDPGPIGPQGEIGPRGLPGEIGISQAITIDGTETIEPNELAEVQDDFESNIHHLTFYIPKGEKGEKGDQGEVGPAPDIAYGERYLDLEQELVLTKDKDTVVPLNLGGPAFFTYFDTENTIEIKQNGFYLISYFFSASPSDDCKITAMVKRNDLLFQACNVTTDMKANTIGNITNTIIGALNDGDKVTLCVRSSVNTTLTFNGSTSANLVLVRIH